MDAVQKRRRKIRQLAIEYMGGECDICSYNNCYEAIVIVKFMQVFCSFHR